MPPPRHSRALLYAIYFVALGHSYLWSVFPRFLEELGWNGAQVGSLYTARKLVEAVCIGLWAWRADQAGERGLLRVQYALAALAMGALALAPQTPWILWIVVCAYSATASCATPLLDALTLRQVGADSGKYGQVRAMGSLGYGGFAALMGMLGLGMNYSEVARLTPLLLGLATCLGAGLIWRLHASPAPPLPTPNLLPDAGILARFRHPILIAMLAFGVVHWMCQTPYNLFFVSLCETKGLPPWTPGAGVCVGVGAEIVVLTAARPLLSRLRPSTLLLWSSAVGAARWALSTRADSAATMILLQATHGINFGVFLLASITIFAGHIPDRWRARGQALFYLSVFTLGSTLGNLVTGRALDALGSVALYESAAWVQLGLTAAAAIAVVGWRVTRTQDRES